MTLPNTHSVVYKWKPLQANRVLKAFESTCKVPVQTASD